MIAKDALLPLSPQHPRWDIARPNVNGATTVGSGERLLITVCVHGNEPCGMLAANELLREGFFDFATDSDGPWPHAWERLTIVLGNPAGLEAGKRFIDTNLNRLFTAEDIQRGCGGGGGDGGAVSTEHGRVCQLASAIEQSTQHVDIHSSSAASAAFCLHFPGAEAAEFAASFPVAYVIQDTSIRRTTINWAFDKGLQKSTLVECGQHDARSSVDIAKRLIRRLVTGKVEPVASQLLRTVGNVKVGSGFRFSKDVTAFQLVKEGELIAQDDEQGEIRCPHAEARIVMPTSLPVVGEEAWLWGVPN